jgi:hypothetical protein
MPQLQARQGGSTMPVRKSTILVVALLLLSVQVPAALAQDGGPMSAEIAPLIEQTQRGEVCAWPVEVAVDALNVAYPEAKASYFVMPYMLAPDQSLILTGTYPFARFSSLVTYFGLGQPGRDIEVLGWLRDTQITPDQGSVNPALDAAAPSDPLQRQWEARITGTIPVEEDFPRRHREPGRLRTLLDEWAQRRAGAKAEENVIPAHPEGEADQLGIAVLRIYVPVDAADHSGGVGLPALALVEADGERRALAECTPEEEQVWTEAIRQMVLTNITAADRLPLPTSADAPPAWVESPVPGLAPNPDNRYLMAPVVWEPGRIVVVRGQGPTFPDTNAGDSVTLPRQLRFWSFCTGSNDVTPPVGYPTAACIGDLEIPVGPDGTYTVVISQPEDRPANAAQGDGVAWLQGADPSLPDLLILRHMLPSDDYYDQSVWAVPELTVGAAEPVMGPYYPDAVYCDKSVFEAGGADACFLAGPTAE